MGDCLKCIVKARTVFSWLVKKETISYSWRYIHHFLCLMQQRGYDDLNKLKYTLYITFENSLQCRTTSAKIWLPGKTLWLFNIVSKKAQASHLILPYRATRGELFVARQEQMITGTQLTWTVIRMKSAPRAVPQKRCSSSNFIWLGDFSKINS